MGEKKARKKMFTFVLTSIIKSRSTLVTNPACKNLREKMDKQCVC
jgi:hypothetical protein